jgi:hypothetical protein
MKVLCPQCERLLELERFRVDGGALVVTCSRCQYEARVEARLPSEAAGPSPVVANASSPLPFTTRSSAGLSSAPTASNVVMLRTGATEAVERAARDAEADPFTVPAGCCPKCITPMPAEARSCAACGAVFAQMDPGNYLPPKWLQAAWLEVLREWGNPIRHNEVRARALALGDLVHLGRLYRLRLAEHPDDPHALAGREELLRAATAALAVRTEPRTDGAPTWAKWLAGAGFLLVVGVFGSMMLKVLAPQAPPGPPNTPPPVVIKPPPRPP